MSARFTARRRAVNALMTRAREWSNRHADVRAVLVVGSYARGNPRMGSDVDLVILTDDVQRHLSDLGFARHIAPGSTLLRCAGWGPMRERRVRLRSGLIVEFDLCGPEWASLPLDPGTANVLSRGCRVVDDDGMASAALASLGLPTARW